MQSQSQLWVRSGTTVSQDTCIIIITANRAVLLAVWEANAEQHMHQTEDEDQFVLPSHQDYACLIRI